MNINAEGVDDSTEGAPHCLDSYTLTARIVEGKQVDINAEGVDDSTEGAPALSRDSYTLKLQEFRKASK